MQNSTNTLIVFLTCVTISCVVLQLELNHINFIMTFSHFSLKKFNKQKLAYKLIVLLIFCRFFQEIIKSIKNLFSNIFPSSMAKCEERKSLPTMSIFFLQKSVFYRMEIRRTVFKTTNDNWVPNWVTETTKGACLASQQGRW